MSGISRADVAHVAHLARLTLTEDEIDLFSDQLGKVIDHFQDVAALDTGQVPATAHPLPLRNVLRPDEPGECLERDEVLAAAPSVEDGRFRVPRILNEAP